MNCCGYNPFVEQPENVVWLCDGDDVPSGWIELSRFSFGCVDAVVVWPEGVPLPPDPAGGRAVIAQSGGVVTNFSRSGVDYTQIIFRSSGTLTVSGTVNAAQWALVGGGGSGGIQNISPGGGGAGWASVDSGDFQPGSYTLTVGAGGPGVSGTSNMRGNSGSASSLTRDGASFLAAPGGGYGGATGAFLAGGPGGCGGGSSGTTANIAGGVGNPGFNGGSFQGSAVEDERSAGGGGGVASAGANGSTGLPSAGGAGVALTWTNPVIECGGGGGSWHRANGGGSATHGGTAGAAKSTNAVNGGGSGAGNRGASLGSGSGGDGFFVIVFPSENGIVV